jgi:hypothetical protein
VFVPTSPHSACAVSLFVAYLDKDLLSESIHVVQGFVTSCRVLFKLFYLVLVGEAVVAGSLKGGLSFLEQNTIFRTAFDDNDQLQSPLVWLGSSPREDLALGNGFGLHK